MDHKSQEEEERNKFYCPLLGTGRRNISTAFDGTSNIRTYLLMYFGNNSNVKPCGSTGTFALFCYEWKIKQIFISIYIHTGVCDMLCHNFFFMSVGKCTFVDWTKCRNWKLVEQCDRHIIGVNNFFFKLSLGYYGIRQRILFKHNS